ncbi:MAG: Ig-like domain-containing protein [Paludibacteraceae bacterium]|nr:Ig-like domain-containing protein [Paludibacteraceae bacterium]MBR1786471.1 Ig-like domain-containing protein [Paludibacteraceae bacterium]
MKKNFVYYLLVAMLLIALPACKKKENGPGGNGGNGGNGGETTSEVKSLSIRQESIELTVGETVTLSIAVEPTNATVTFKSSNEEIATVDENGSVLGVSVGEAKIVASAGDKTAECPVNVVNNWDAAQFNQAFIGTTQENYDNPVASFKYTTSSGEVRNYKIIKGTCSLFSEGLFLNSEYKMDGSATGSIIDIDATFCLDDKYWYYLGLWEVFTPSEAYLNDSIPAYIARHKEKYPEDDDVPADFYLTMLGAPGEINEQTYLEKVKTFVEKYNAWADEQFADESTVGDEAFNALHEANNSISNTVLSSYEYHTVAEGYPEDNYYYTSSIQADALVSDLQVYIPESATNPMDKISFYDMKLRVIDGIYGLDADVDEETGKIIVNDDSKVKFEDITLNFGSMPKEKPAKGMKIVRLNPQQYEKFRANLKKIQPVNNANKHKRIR